MNLGCERSFVEQQVSAHMSPPGAGDSHNDEDSSEDYPPHAVSVIRCRLPLILFCGRSYDLWNMTDIVDGHGAGVTSVSVSVLPSELSTSVFSRATLPALL